MYQVPSSSEMMSRKLTFHFFFAFFVLKKMKIALSLWVHATSAFKIYVEYLDVCVSVA